VILFNSTLTVFSFSGWVSNGEPCGMLQQVFTVWRTTCT